MTRATAASSVLAAALLLALPAAWAAPPSSALAHSGRASAPKATVGSAIQLVNVDCGGGDTLTEELARNLTSPSIRLLFTGTCQEKVVLRRDDVTIVGQDPTATLRGSIEIEGASRISLERFTIIGDPDLPFSDSNGGISATRGAAITVRDVQVEGIMGTGVRVVGATAFLENVRSTRNEFGGYVFRAANIELAGSIAGDDTFFGMDVVNSGVFARLADLSFSGNLFGLLIQESSGIEHIQGHLTTRDNTFGIFLASQGTYAFAAEVESSRNALVGVFVDELSNFTPIAGAPVAGPAVRLLDNGQAGAVVERLSALHLVGPSEVSGNGVGIQVDNSLLRLADTTVQGNTGADLILAFRSTATFEGANNLGGPIQCDATVATRGSASCGTLLGASPAPALGERLGSEDRSPEWRTTLRHGRRSLFRIGASPPARTASKPEPSL